MTPRQRKIIDQEKKYCDCLFCSTRCPNCGSTNVDVVVEHTKNNTMCLLLCNVCQYTAQNKSIEEAIKKACKREKIYDAYFIAHNDIYNKIVLNPIPRRNKKLIGLEFTLLRNGKGTVKKFEVQHARRKKDEKN